MKITKNQLKQIIKEELSVVLREGETAYSAGEAVGRGIENIRGIPGQIGDTWQQYVADPTSDFFAGAKETSGVDLPAGLGTGIDTYQNMITDAWLPLLTGQTPAWPPSTTGREIGLGYGQSIMDDWAARANRTAPTPSYAQWLAIESGEKTPLQVKQEMIDAGEVFPHDQ
jgi:hypothetical protein